MSLIVEVFWKLAAFVFTVSLPFILLVLAIWHPHLSPQTNNVRSDWSTARSTTNQ